MSVILETTLGDIIVDLYTSERPTSCLNFLKLCKSKYYNFTLFHKVERNFIAQTGDPSGTGRGGESVFCRLYGEQAKFFDAETKPRIKHRKLGTLSMVNNGNNMHGSQFFLTLGEDLEYLDGVHTVFGEVTEGMDTLMKINEVICDEEHRPYQDVRLTHTVILDDPFDDPHGLEIPDRSPEPTKEQLSSGRIGADEEIDDTKGKSMEEIDEEIKDKTAKAQAIVLEMVGDIPDADVKPPENVLFVCKLNPVTSSEDLEIIFSRFGPIKSCEVIKDRITGESLQYAFIEFENERDCENAYFKMDNVLIDDRRIHVDFSQSVAKLKEESVQRNKLEKEVRPKYSLKDKSSIQKDTSYELIFDESVNVSPKLNSKKKKKKHKRLGSSDGSDKEVRNRKHKTYDYSRSKSGKKLKHH
ncbi:peptidyl-prolyl cis-trans isomerase-like 4 [Limulus polyphemus]|uniref:Peptidyl-prolyl cis-trans isomerase n=1 Tax=Limulus polyphemus TaxID=6850 RepID=A0ABM1BJF4_LIMPO|nr:peptidyl-prolyl cis-trans isomerase-like 4 [Limulus polyphemus]